MRNYIRVVRMHKSFVFLPLMLLLLAVPSNADFSSENVKNFALVYSTRDEAVVVPAEFQPAIYKEDTYWFAYLTPQDSDQKNLILIIRQTDQGGVLETTEETLKFLYSLDYDLDTLRMLKERGIAFADLKNVMDSLKYQIENTERPVLENIKLQSELDFSKIDDALLDMESSADDALTLIGDGIAYEEVFRQSFGSQEVTSADLENVLETHGRGVTAIHSFIGVAEKYQKSVAEMQLKPEAQLIASELAKLGNLKVKDAVLQSYNASLALKMREVELREGRKDSQVQDAIYSFFLRKARVEAQDAYDRAAASSPIESLLSAQNELSLKDCKLSNADLRKKWDLVKSIMNPAQPHSAQDYGNVPRLVSEAVAQADNLNSRLNSCLNASPAPQPTPQGFDYRGIAMPAVFLVVLVLAAYYLNNYMKRKPDEENMQQ